MMFFFKQKTAYEMRISDWSSDVCSSDLFRPESNFLRNQNLTSRRECSRPREPMAHSDSPATPGAPRAAAGGGVRMVRAPDDRAGQRLDNFLLGQLKGAPKSLVYKIVRSGQVRVNGGRAKADTRLEGGDEVRIPPVRLTEPGEKGVPAKGLLEGREAASGGGDRKGRSPDDRGRQTLYNYLLGQLKGAPKSLVYKVVRSGHVRVNGGRAKADIRLEGGDEVRIPPVRLTEPGEKGVPAKGLLEAMEASIVFEDARLLAISKPSGVASHGGSGISFGVIETLRALRPQQSLELVHRLDRDTSGLMVVAKKRSALTQLQALMREDRSEERRGGEECGGT